MNELRSRGPRFGKDKVRVGRSRTGRGVFANRRYRCHDLIGEIAGQIIPDVAYGSDYCFELDEVHRLEPLPPFRFINHSCDPNCEFDCFDLPAANSPRTTARVYLFATRSIHVNEELTIDYNWSAGAAIPCKCGAANCRGWIVDRSELWKLDSSRAKVSPGDAMSS